MIDIKMMGCEMSVNTRENFCCFYLVKFLALYTVEDVLFQTPTTPKEQSVIPDTVFTTDKLFNLKKEKKTASLVQTL